MTNKDLDLIDACLNLVIVELERVRSLLQE